MLPFSEDNERILLLQISEGDERAFRILFNHYWKNIYGVAMAFTKSDTLADELVQDIFLKIWLKREQLATIEKFGNYLFILSRNHIFNELRKKTREKPFTESLLNYIRDTAPCPDDVLYFKQTTELLNNAIGHLPVQQRRVYQLSRENGLSHEAIAVSLRISKNTVKSHIHQALLFIRSYLMKHSTVIIFPLLLACL
jgi:RNA polymerase sigma-70 factor (family 1)